MNRWRYERPRKAFDSLDCVICAIYIRSDLVASSSSVYQHDAWCDSTSPGCWWLAFLIYCLLGGDYLVSSSINPLVPTGQVNWCRSIVIRWKLTLRIMRTPRLFTLSRKITVRLERSRHHLTIRRTYIVNACVSDVNDNNVWDFKETSFKDTLIDIICPICFSDVEADLPRDLNHTKGKVLIIICISISIEQNCDNNQV